MKSVPHKTLKTCTRELLIFAQGKMKVFKGIFKGRFQDLKYIIMVYNNLKPGKHIFRSSSKVFFTSRQNFQASLRVVHISSVQGCTPTPRFLKALFDMFKL